MRLIVHGLPQAPLQCCDVSGNAAQLRHFLFEPVQQDPRFGCDGCVAITADFGNPALNRTEQTEQVGPRFIIACVLPAAYRIADPGLDLLMQRGDTLIEAP